MCLAFRVLESIVWKSEIVVTVVVTVVVVIRIAGVAVIIAPAS